jgi:hypothetical protein
MSINRVYLLAVAAVMGCASSSTSDDPRTGMARGSGPLTAEELTAAHADVNTAYDAVARLRPNWLASHGTTSLATGSEYAVVFVDGQQYGTLDSLRQIQAYQVGDIRYYDVTQAGARFGLRAGGGGAIEVKMKTP